MENVPEPRLDPPEPFFITAKCGHEVYDGETLFEWKDYKKGEWVRTRICPDCFDRRLERLSREAKANLLGMDYKVIHNPHSGGDTDEGF